MGARWRRDRIHGDERRGHGSSISTTCAAGPSGRVTNDAFADLQPAWSPDGRRIAFATDRFTTRLYAPSPRAAIGSRSSIDTNAIAPLGTSTVGDDVNPQWSPDGGASTSSRTAPAFRTCTELAWTSNGTIKQLTDVATGVSGITSNQSGDVGRGAIRPRRAQRDAENSAYGTYLVDPGRNEDPPSRLAHRRARRCRRIDRRREPALARPN